LQKKPPTGDSTGPEESGKDENKECQSDNDDHLDVASARETIAKQCLRNGDARYAIKRLRNDLPKTLITRGILDLAVEAKFLTVLCHPNIIKMRGLAEGDVLRNGYFIILDRLYGTLVDKMDEWAKRKKRHNKIMFKTKNNKNHLQDLLTDRMMTAFDLAAAFRYLHSMNLVYRDIKPENIGFDVRGDVKVFDFGLCKNLSPNLNAGAKDSFHLTGICGTHPYMAPEVARQIPYGQGADVYSFAILFWEILALEIPYEKLLNKRADYECQVLLNGNRPPLPRSCPPLSRHIISECWAADPAKRPNFTRIASVIRGDLSNLTHDAKFINRSAYMMDRSKRSNHGLDSGSFGMNSSSRH